MKFYTHVDQVSNKILVRAIEDGVPVQYRVDYNPTLYVLSKNKTEYKTLEGRCVTPISPGSMSECREYINTYKNVNEYPIYGNIQYLYQYISDEYPGEEISYDVSQIRVFVIDIETSSENGFPDIRSANEEILSITVYDSSSQQYMVWGIKDYLNKDKDVTYHNCGDEDTLLKKFLAWWEQNYPDVITGWNVNFFDIPYICNRITRLYGEKVAKLISPWRLLSNREVTIAGRTNMCYELCGISILDYYDLYKKFTYTNQESYRLDHICNVELGAQKLDHSEYDTFKEFYTKNWQKFVEYNIHDVRLVNQLDDKMKLLELAITMAYDAKVNYEDVYSQVRMWDCIIYNFLRSKNIVIPPKRDNRKDSQYAGAYVKEPVPGMYDWVVNFDLNSLYPHLIMQYNISPETLLPTRHSSVDVNKLLNQELDLSNLTDHTICANGTFYSTTKHGFLPMIMEKIYSERTIYKEKMLNAKRKYEETKHPEILKDIAKYNNIQMARKIQLNSAYGAIGNEYFRYFRIENAEAITLSGQLSIRWIENKMNAYLNKALKTTNKDYVIAVDTDSIYLNLGDLVKSVFKGGTPSDEKVVSFLDKLCKVELEPYIESCYEELATYVNAYEQKMIMKRENIASRGIWTVKKRYILNVWDSEGVRYKEPKMKIMGLETQRSSTPAYFRDKLKQAYKIIMTSTNEDLIDFIEQVRKETKEQKYSDIAFPRSVNNLEKYRHSIEIYKKSVPIQVRGALLYNYYVSKHNIGNKYAKIQEGEKIKYIYLRLPNPMHENVISFFQEIPKELNLEKYIDYTMQFEKSFFEPLSTVLDCINWKTKKTVSLLNFFS